MTNVRKIIATAVMLCTPLAMVAPANAAFPDQPIKIVVPYSTGGSSDNIARLVADMLSKDLGQPVLVENKPGAGSMIGTAYAAKETPDGYTMLLVDVPFTIVPALYQDRIDYDVKKDFAPIGLVGQSPMYLFVSSDFKAKTLQELAGRAKAAPGTVTIGSGGNGSFSHLLAELFMRESGTKLVHVPYKGAAAAITDLAGGQIDASFSSMPSAAAIYKTGKIVPIGISSPARHPDTPNVSTFKESGFESMTISSWWGLVVPAKTPDEVRSKLSKALLTVLKDKKLQERLGHLGVDVPEQADPETMSQVLNESLDRWDGLIRSANIKLN